MSTTDVDKLAALLQETEEHHGEYEPNAPEHHWSTWYAGYIVAREAGKSEDEAVEEATRHTEAAGG